MRYFLTILLACGLLVPASAADPESWDIGQVMEALDHLEVRPERPCPRPPVSSGWAGLKNAVESLHGGKWSPYDGACFPALYYVEIEHIVARREADDSGMCGRGPDERLAFVEDQLNLTFAPGGLNASKGDRDPGGVMAERVSLFRDSLSETGECFWAAQTVRVKSKWKLSVDARERDALGAILTGCGLDRVPVSRPQAPAGCGM